MKKLEIRMARHWGMCFGVKDALAMVHQSAKHHKTTVLGELVHNPVVERQLRERGVQQSHLGMAPVNGAGVLVITAHGVSSQARADLKKTGQAVLDTTCPLVWRAHLRLGELVREGYFPVVIGQSEHVEVRGLTGDHPHAVVVEREEDVARIPVVKKVGVIAQTTQPLARVQRLVELMRRQRPTSEIKFCDTVCQPTKDRQAALAELCADVEVLVVVGGRMSNNTRQLAATGRAMGCTVYHVEGADELQPRWFLEISRVGVTAGTSTLDETVEAVRERLERFAAGAGRGLLEGVAR